MSVTVLKAENNVNPIIVKMIENGKDNQQLFEDVITSLQGAMIYKERFDSLMVQIFKSTFRSMSKPKITHAQLANYEAFIEKISEFMRPVFSDFKGDEFFEMSKFDPNNESSFNLMFRLLPKFLYDFDISRSTNKDGLTLLQLSLVSSLNGYDKAISENLIKFGMVDIDVQHPRYGKAMHFIWPLQHSDKFKNKVCMLIDAGANPAEQVSFMPYQSSNIVRFNSYLDYMVRYFDYYNARKMYTGFSPTPQTSLYYKENLNFIKSLVKAQTATANVNINNSDRARLRSL